jgi:hypothetical protein
LISLTGATVGCLPWCFVYKFRVHEKISLLMYQTYRPSVSKFAHGRSWTEWVWIVYSRFRVWYWCKMAKPAAGVKQCRNVWFTCTLTQLRVRTVCCFKLISKHDKFPLKMMYIIVPKRVYRLLCVYDCANENNVLMETMLQNGVASLLVQKSSIFSASYWIVEKIVKTKMWNYILDVMTIVLNGDVYLTMFYVLTIFVWKNGNTEKYRYAYAK